MKQRTLMSMVQLVCYLMNDHIHLQNVLFVHLQLHQESVDQGQ